MAAGAIVTCIVVVVGFQLTKSGKTDTGRAAEQYTSIMSQYDQIQLTMYEDMQISGSDVVNYIKENAGVLVNKQIKQIEVETKNGKSAYSSTDSNDSTVEKIKEKLRTNQSNVGGGNYINPSGMFECEIKRNANGMIEAINFRQV